MNLNQYAGSGTFFRWHGDNEPLLGPQNFPKLIVSLSLGNSVEFMVRRRAPGKVPSSIRLDHGDVLVLDGLAQSEYEHCVASGLQGSRVNLTYRWVAQHTASCPLAGVVGCVLPTCAQGLVEPSSRWLGEGENKWTPSWGLVLLLLILVFVLLVGTLINTRRRHRYSGQRPSCSVVHFPSRGPARWVGRRRWRLSRRRHSSKGASFYFPCVCFWENKLFSFFKSIVVVFLLPLGMLVAKWVPTPCYLDAYLVGTPKWAFWEKGWLKQYKSMIFSLCWTCLLSKQKDDLFYLEGYFMDVPFREDQHSGPGPRVFTPGQLSVEFVNVGGWLTYGDLAMDSCAQFLAVAEHRLIPARARSVGHPESWSSFGLGSCLSGSDCWRSCGSWGHQSWWCSPISPILYFVSPQFKEFFRLGRV